MRSVLELLPRGGTLPDASWERRHRGIVMLLWGHVGAVAVFGLFRNYSVIHSLTEAGLIATAAAVAMAAPISRRARAVAAAVGLMSSSAVLVHLSGGLIEMHFHFFVMVVVVSLYQDWVPFLITVGYVFVHHGLIGVIDPESVYNHPAALANPWKWAGVHAFFIAGTSMASVVNWRLSESYLAHRRRAEERLREESRIVEQLSEVGRLLASELQLDHVVQRVTDVATGLTSAQFGAFFYNVSDESGDSYLLYSLSGAPPEAFAKFPAPRATGVFGPTFAGEGVVRLDDVTTDPRYGKNPPYHGMPPGHLPVRSYLAVPVVSRGTVIGGLFFGHPEPARFTEADERIVVGVAAHAAVAVQNARLYQSELQAREHEEAARRREEAARRRLAVVADASRRLLDSKLELDAMLRQLTALTVPEIADGCCIDLVDDTGALCRVASALRTADGTIDERLPSPPVVPPSDPVGRVLRTARAELFQSGDEGLGQFFELDPCSSAVVVPMPSRDRVVGVMTLLTMPWSNRELGSDELEVAEELGRRAAAAVENARLFAGHRDAAQTLQHSLLPDTLPRIPGVEMAGRYLPGGAGVEVGGDWYDVIPLADGSVGLVMGDVVGRGIPAASLMGQFRNALRAYAFEGHSPGKVLSRLNGVLGRQNRPDHMATLIYAVFDPGQGELRLANAGHPPPALRAADGTVTFLEGPSGVPLGVMPGARYEEWTVSIEPGSTLVFYTDGLIETRGLRLDDGLDELRDSLADGDDVEKLCDHILSHSTAQRVSRDDTAILVVSYPQLSERLHFSLPAQPDTLKPLRSVLRRWLREGGVIEEEAFEILVATGEACGNVIRHATLSGATTFDLDIHRDGEVRVTVRDRGRWLPATPRDTGGRGLAIMEQLMDEVEIIPGPPETVVALRRTLSNGRHASA